MLDRIKRSSDTSADTPEESRMAPSPEPVVDVEPETDENIVRRISRDPRVLARIKQSILDSENGRVVSRDKATEKLKKRAS